MLTCHGAPRKIIAPLIANFLTAPSLRGSGRSAELHSWPRARRAGRPVPSVPFQCTFYAMTNLFAFDLHPKELRWAAAEGVSEDVIAATLLLHDRSGDEIAPQLSAVELGQVIVLVGRNPRLYPPGLLDALEQQRSFPDRRRPKACRTLRSRSKQRPRIADVSPLAGSSLTLTECSKPMSAGWQCSERASPWVGRSPRGPFQPKNPEPVPERALKPSDGGSKWRS